MSTFQFLHCADLHLDSPLRGLAAYPGAPAGELRGATRRAFEALIDLAIAERVRFVLIAGDVYDGDWPDDNTGLWFAHQLGRLGRERQFPPRCVRSEFAPAGERIPGRTQTTTLSSSPAEDKKPAETRPRQRPDAPSCWHASGSRSQTEKI